MLAYIDDILGWSSDRQIAWAHFRANRQLMTRLGLQESPEKATEPTQRITWIGVTFDSVTMVMSIPRQKIVEVLAEVHTWIGKQSIGLRQLQKLLGRLFHVTKCCGPARLFCNRLLDGLRQAYRHGSVPMSTDMRQDLFWDGGFPGEIQQQTLDALTHAHPGHHSRLLPVRRRSSMGKEHVPSTIH